MGAEVMVGPSSIFKNIFSSILSHCKKPMGAIHLAKGGGKMVMGPLTKPPTPHPTFLDN